MLRTVQHVKFVDINFVLKDKGHYTRHGLHLNETGKVKVYNYIKNLVTTYVSLPKNTVSTNNSLSESSIQTDVYETTNSTRRVGNLIYISPSSDLGKPADTAIDTNIADDHLNV